MTVEGVEPSCGGDAPRMPALISIEIFIDFD